ncbi:MAG: hypothetical protein HXX81_06280 [Campylobacterales bacterium]|nr:hypothetical protein [Campylobacterales bacterium]
MQLFNMGKKPIIGSKGITFSPSNDKFIYLEDVCRVLNALRETKSQDVEILNDNSKIGDISSFILNSDEKVAKVNAQREKYINKLEDEEKTVSERKMDSIDKKIYLENLEIEKPIRVQRAVNKMVYHVAIDEIVDIMLKNSISSIKTPFNGSFQHILNSIKNTLINRRFSLKIELVGYYKDDNIFLILKNPYF